MTNRYVNQKAEAILIAVGKNKAHEIKDGTPLDEVAASLSKEHRAIYDLLMSDKQETISLIQDDGVIRNPNDDRLVYEQEVKVDPFTASVFTFLSREVGLDLTRDIFIRMYGKRVTCCNCGEEFNKYTTFCDEFICGECD